VPTSFSKHLVLRGRVQERMQANVVVSYFGLRMSKWVLCCCVVLLCGQTAAASLTQIQTPYIIEGGYLAFRASGFAPADFNAFVSEPADVIAQVPPLLVFVSGSGCSSNFRLSEGRGQPAWFDKEIRQVAGRVQFLVPDRPGVRLLEQSPHPGLGTDCSTEFALHSDFEEVAQGLAALVDYVVAKQKGRPPYVLVIGVSDGGPIAAKVAAKSKSVSHVALISGGGDNQLEELLLSPPTNGGFEERDNDRVENVFQMLSEVLRSTDGAEVLFGHPVKRWKSAFAISVRGALRESPAAVYLVGGTHDESVPIASTDLLAANLIRAGKSLVFERIPGADHGLRTNSADPTARRQKAIRSIINWAGGAPVHGPDVIWPARLERN
jgi:pimeloyl-ACP methyl ester carboxylesterase